MDGVYSLRCNSASADDIERHLCACDADFLARLRRRSPLSQYCEKLAELAETSEIWAGEQLVALCAYYVNRPESRVGFISNVSVVSERFGEGLGKKVVNDSLARMAAAGFKHVELEVAVDSRIAQNLYAGLGFTADHWTQDGSLIMRRTQG